MGSIQPSEAETIKSGLQEAHEDYALKHPQSKKNHEEACKYLPGGNTRTVLHTVPFPLTVRSGRSCYLETVDGHEYIDFLGEYTAGIYGHDHPVIRKAIENALDGGWNYGAHNRMEQELARVVCTRFPSLQKVRFVNSGTEANMMALATAVVYTGKKKILVFNKGYHGSTISGRAASDKPSINLPHEFVVGTYNDMNLEENLVSKLSKGSLAAILVEPMLGSGGCFVGEAEWLKLLRRIADEQGALLIFDEVMTSRLAYKGFHTIYNITPDLMTLGKWVGGGMSFGAFGGKDEIMSLYDPRNGKLEHPGTFNNNVFSMTAGIAGCKLLDEDCLKNLNELGTQMRKDVDDVFKKYQLTGPEVPTSPVTDEMHDPSCSRHPPVVFIKGVGSLMSIHFAGPNKDALQGLFFHHMLRQGIYMAQRGFIALSIEVSSEHINKFVQAVDEFCSRWQADLQWH